MTEDISSLLFDAAMLLLVGMSVVFIFLTILIGAIILIEKLCGNIADEQSDTASATVSHSSTPTTAGVNPQVVAAITAAVHQHRNK